MAGSCNGLGVRQNAENQIELAVDRQQVWPYASNVKLKNGARVDPVTGYLWVPPDQIIKVAEAPLGPNKTVVPNDDDTIALTDLSLEMTASPDHDQVMFQFHLVGGYQGYRMGNGNFWAVYRHITTYDDTAVKGKYEPITFSGVQEVGGHENNAGTSSGSASVVEGMIGMAVKPGGSKFKVAAHYELRPLAFTASGVNGFTWRPPRLQIMQLSMPQEVDLMATLTDVSYWKDVLTGDVMRQETYDDGTVLNPRPSTAVEATEQDYFYGLGQGQQETAEWNQTGIDTSG